MSRRDPLLDVILVGGVGVGLWYALMRPHAVTGNTELDTIAEKGALLNQAANQAGDAARMLIQGDPQKDAKDGTPANQADTHADYSKLWGRRVGQAVGYSSGVMVTVFAYEGMTTAYFAGDEPSTRSARWSLSPTGSSAKRIPWDTRPNDYDWSGGSPSPADALRGAPTPSDPLALLGKGATYAQDRLTGLMGFTLPDAWRQTPLGGLLPNVFGLGFFK